MLGISPRESTGSGAHAQTCTCAAVQYRFHLELGFELMCRRTTGQCLWFLFDGRRRVEQQHESNITRYVSNFIHGEMG